MKCVPLCGVDIAYHRLIKLVCSGHCTASIRSGRVHFLSCRVATRSSHMTLRRTCCHSRWVWYSSCILVWKKDRSKARQKIVSIRSNMVGWRSKARNSAHAPVNDWTSAEHDVPTRFCCCSCLSSVMLAVNIRSSPSTPNWGSLNAPGTKRPQNKTPQVKTPR